MSRSKEPSENRGTRQVKEELEQKIEVRTQGFFKSLIKYWITKGIINELSNTVTPKELEQFKEPIMKEISKHQDNMERLENRVLESQRLLTDLNRKFFQIEKAMHNSDLPLTIEHLDKGDKATADLSPINKNIKDIYSRIKKYLY